MSDYSAIYQEAGQQHDVDPALLRAIVETESGGNPQAVSPQGAVGPAQLMPETAEKLGVEDPTDPRQAIFAAARLLDQNMTRYGNVDDAILAYHGGTDKRNWGPKTQAYHQKVMAAFSGQNPQSADHSGPTDDDLLSGFDNQNKDISDSDLLAGLPNAGDVPRGTLINPNAPFHMSADLPTFDTSGRIGAGIAQGAADIGHGALNYTNWLEQHSPGNLLLNSLGLPQARPINALETFAGVNPQQNAAEVQKYRQEFGNSLASTIGRVGSQTAMVAPVVSAALPAAATASPALASGLGMVGNTLRAVPFVGPLTANALTGATQGGATSLLTSQANPEVSLGQQVQQGAKIGGALGALSPLVTGTAKKVYNALTGTGSVSPVAADLADTAVNQYGIPVRGSQITDNPFIRRLDTLLGNIPFSGMKASNEEIAETFNRAAARTIGADSPVLTPEVVSAAKRDIGQKFDDVAARTTIQADNSFLNDLASVQQEARQVLTKDELSPIENQIDNVLGKVSQNGQISGDVYQALTRRGAPLDRAMESSNPNIANYASRIRDALDNALERSAPQEVRDLLTEAKYQWKNYKTLKPLIEKAPEGQISPALLLNRVRQVYGDMDIGGGGDLGELARIGQRFLKPASSSGTAENLGIGGLLAESGAALAHPPLALKLIGGTAGTLGAGRLASSALRSDWYRNMLLNNATQSGGNQALANALTSPSTAIPLTVNAAPLFFPSLANAR